MNLIRLLIGQTKNKLDIVENFQLQEIAMINQLNLNHLPLKLVSVLLLCKNVKMRQNWTASQKHLLLIMENNSQNINSTKKNTSLVGVEI